MSTPSILPNAGRNRTLSPAQLLILLGSLVAFGPLAIDLYLPALPAIGRGLHASAAQVQLSISVFLAGFSVGMLLYGPLSDRYGRRPVLLWGIGLFVLASLACMVAQSVEQLIGARVVQALGGGAASVLARAVVRDTYAPTEAIRNLSLMAMITAIAPLLAPVLGSQLLEWSGWRATFAAVLGWGVLSWAVVWRYLAESLPPEKRGTLSMRRAFAIYGEIVRDGGAVGLLLAGGMSFAAMFAYITASPFYFIELAHFSPQAYSGIFALNALGIFAANWVNSRAVRHHGPATMSLIGTVLAVGGAAILWVGAIQPQGLVWVITGLLLVVSMTGLLGANCVGMLMGRYPDNAGAAAALFGASQFGLGMLASTAVSYAHDGSAMPMVWVIAVVSLLGLVGQSLLMRDRTRHHPTSGA